MQANAGLRILKGIIRLGELSATGEDQVNTLLSQIVPRGYMMWEEKIFHTIVAPMIDGSNSPEFTAFELRLGILPDGSFASVTCRMAFQVPDLPTLIVSISDIGDATRFVAKATSTDSLVNANAMNIALLTPDPLKLMNPFFKPYAIAIQKLRLLATRWKQTSHTLPFLPFSERGRHRQAKSDGQLVTEQEYREGRLNPQSRSFEQKLLAVKWNIKGPAYYKLLRKPHPDPADDMDEEPPLRRRRHADDE